MTVLAEHVLAVAHRYNTSVTNLQLQKIMYFSLGNYLRDTGNEEQVKELYEVPFEAWRYGPVIPEDYHYYKKYGSSTIMEAGEYKEALLFLDAYIRELFDKSTFSMVRESHDNKFWSRNKEEILQGSSPEYSFEDLRNDFI